MEIDAQRAILEGVDRLAEHLPVDRSALDGQEPLRSAILWVLSVIGQAASDLPPQLRARYPDAPWQEVIDVGRHALQEYYAIDTDRAWRLLHGGLEPLRVAVEAMLAELGES